MSFKLLLFAISNNHVIYFYSFAGLNLFIVHGSVQFYVIYTSDDVVRSKKNEVLNKSMNNKRI